MRLRGQGDLRASDPAIHKAMRTILRLDLKPWEESPQEQESRLRSSCYQAGWVSGQVRAELAHVLLSHSGLMVPAQMRQQELALQMVLLESLARPSSNSMSCSPQVQAKLRLPLLLVPLWQVARIPERHRAQDRCLETAHDQWQIRELSEHPTLDGWRLPTSLL